MATTTMESNTNSDLLQNSVQSLAQNQAQLETNPPSGDSPSATISSTPCAPPASSTLDFDARARKKQRDAELRTLSKSFGHVPNVPIFAQWERRQGCLDSAVHRSILAGICGNSKDGAFSVVLSGSYEDDEDGGDVMSEFVQDRNLYLTIISIYTGTGGRERWTNTFPPKRLRLGPQTKDQSWNDSGNKALQISSLTEKPVRVIRSWRCPSQYAPLTGYRYDGLYKVAACWTARGQNGKNICRCRLERLPDQPPVPLRPITMSTSKRKRRREHLVANLPPNSLSSTNQHDSLGGSDVGMSPNQPAVSPGQWADSAGGESEELQSSQQQVMCEISTGTDFDMGEVDPDVKQPRPVSPQPRALPKPCALPRYRWDPRNNELIRIPASDVVEESDGAARGNEEENRMERDDATLVPSDDDHPNFEAPANERMETEYFSDIGNADKPYAPDSSSMNERL